VLEEVAQATVAFVGTLAICLVLGFLLAYLIAKSDRS